MARTAREMLCMPAFASRACLRFRRASFSSKPACFALPLSSSASMMVSERALYASVLRKGSVVLAMVFETAADAREIYGTLVRLYRGCASICDTPHA